MYSNVNRCENTITDIRHKGQKYLTYGHKQSGVQNNDLNKGFYAQWIGVKSVCNTMST